MREVSTGNVLKRWGCKKMLSKSASLIFRLLFVVAALGAQCSFANDACSSFSAADITTYLPDGEGYWMRGRNGPNGSAISVCTERGKGVPVAFISEDSAQEFADLHILSIQSFYGLLIVTQESGAAYRIRIFAYDIKANQVREMASDGSKFLPSLGYLGSELQPVVGVIHSALDSRVSSQPLPKEEVLYFLDKSKMNISSKRKAWSAKR